MPVVEAVVSSKANCIRHVPEAKISVTSTLSLVPLVAKAFATHVVPLRSLILTELEADEPELLSSSEKPHPARRQKARAARSRISSLEGLKV